jgi:hypothetical protein
MSESILSRRNFFSSLSSPDLPKGESPSSAQLLVDGLVTRFVDEAADIKTLASLTAGGLAYRYGKAAVLSSQFSVVSSGMVLPSLMRGGSVAFGLATEVTAFEFTNRSLDTILRATGRSPLQDPSPNVWSWSGTGGWKQSLINDGLTFGILKGAGYLSRESNVVFQHAFSSTAMVAGHQASAFLGIAPKAEGSLAEQLLHAEATNLQLGAGTSLVHSMAPGISALERGLDLTLQSVGQATSRSPLRMDLQGALAGGYSNGGANSSKLTAGRRESPLQNPKEFFQPLLMASAHDPDSGGGNENTPSTLPTGVEAEEHAYFLTLASRLGISVLSYRAGQDMTRIRQEARSRVMDLISEPDTAATLSRESLEQLRSFVVGGEAPNLNQALLELVEKSPNQAEPVPDTEPAVVGANRALLRVPEPPTQVLPRQPLQVLMLKELSELLQNPKIATPSPDGRIQITLQGKNNLLLQDYFDFYQLVFHQAREFKGMMEHLQRHGVDIMALAPRIERMDRELRQAAVQLKEGHGEGARPYLENVDLMIEDLQREVFQIFLGMGWGAPHFGGQLALYGRNRLPLALDPRLLPSPQAAAAQPAAFKNPEALKNSPQEDYMVFIDRIDWTLNFSKHPLYYLYQGEKNYRIAYDEGYRIETNPLPEPNQLLGTFQRSNEGIVFEYVSGERTVKRRFDPQQISSEDSQSSYRRGRNKVVIVPLAQPLTEHFARVFAQREEKVEDSLKELLTHLLQVEKSVREKEAHAIRTSQYHWTQIGRIFETKSPFEEAVENAKKEDAYKIASEVVFFLGHPWGSLKSRAKELLTALLPKVSHKEQQELIPLIVTSYFLEPDVVLPFSKPHEILQKILNPLSIDARKTALKLIVQQIASGREVAQNDLDFLENLLGSFPIDVLEKVVGPNDPRSLQLLVKAYRGGLPMVKPLYDQYLSSSDPDQYIAHAVERIRYYRKGGFLFSKDPNLLAMAYGSLDNPEQLSFEQFAREVILDDLPKPFMNEPFQVEVPLVKVAHAKVDKGVIKEAYATVAKVHEKTLLVQYLGEILAKPKQSGLSPFREKLPIEEITEENVIEVSKKILGVLAEKRKNLSTQAREVVTNLAFGIAAQSENGQALLPTLALYQEKMPSDHLLQVLNALREFYGDAVGEVLKAFDLKLKPVEQMGERLKKQMDQMKLESGDVQIIDLVPSKSQTDVFAGYVGEDCTKSRWKEAIRRPDTQVYRMLSNHRLAGMLYLKRQVLDDDVVLVVGIEPRARFRVNAEALLEEVIRGLGEIASKGDYDYVLISTNSHERSNRPDMNDAIEKRFQRYPPKIYSEKVDGGIFSNNKFHVAWDRPANLPKGPAPSDSLKKVVSHGAQTVLGNISSVLWPTPPTPGNDAPGRRRR